MCAYGRQSFTVGVRAYTHIGSSKTLRLYTDISLVSDWLKTAIGEIHVHYNSQGGHLIQGDTPPHEQDPSDVDPFAVPVDSADQVQWIYKYSSK